MECIRLRKDLFRLFRKIPVRKTNLMKRKQSRSFSSALFYYSKVKHNVVKTTSNANSIFKWNHVTPRRVNANMQNPTQ